jgi:hypothetical protein
MQVAQLAANVLVMAELDCRADLKAKDLSGGDFLRYTVHTQLHILEHLLTKQCCNA